MLSSRVQSWLSSSSSTSSDSSILAASTSSSPSSRPTFAPCPPTRPPISLSELLMTSYFWLFWLMSSIFIFISSKLNCSKMFRSVAGSNCFLSSSYLASAAFYFYSFKSVSGFPSTFSSTFEFGGAFSSAFWFSISLGSFGGSYFSCSLF